MEDLQQDQPDSEASVYFGYLIEPHLLLEIEQLLADIMAGTRDRKNRQLSSIILRLLDESMEVFFMEPLRLVGNDPIGAKIVTTGVNTVKKIIGVLVKSLSARLSNEQLKPLGIYFTEILYRVEAPKVQGGETGGAARAGAVEASAEKADIAVFMGAPLSRALNVEFETVLQQLEAGESVEARPRLIEVLLAVTTVAIDVYFSESIKRLNLNSISRRAAQTAISGTRGVITKVVARVIRAMNDEQVLIVTRYLAGLRKSKDEFMGDLHDLR